MSHANPDRSRVREIRTVPPPFNKGGYGGVFVLPTARGGDARARILSRTQNGGIPIPFRTAGKDSRRVGCEMGISHQPATGQRTVAVVQRRFGLSGLLLAAWMTLIPSVGLAQDCLQWAAAAPSGPPVVSATPYTTTVYEPLACPANSLAPAPPLASGQGVGYYQASDRRP